MTKYVLHGGAAQHLNSKNDQFFKEIFKDTPQKTKILLVHFASTTEKNEINIQKDTTQFERAKGNKNVHYDEAIKENFLEQTKDADIIYFGGGTTIKLIEELKKFTNLKEALNGKTIAGESAGMNFLAEYCYSKSGGGIMKCLGILPIKTIPHYTDEFKVAKEELEKINQNLETITLPEYTHFIYKEE